MNANSGVQNAIRFSSGTMRVMLPVCALSLFSLYGLFLKRSIEIETSLAKGRATVEAVTPTLNGLSMKAPSFEGFDPKNGSRYRLAAAEAVTDLTQSKPIELRGLDGTFEETDGSATRVRARRGVFDRKAGQLRMDGGINIQGPNDIEVRMTDAVLDTKTAAVTSNNPSMSSSPPVNSAATPSNSATKSVKSSSPGA